MLNSSFKQYTYGQEKACIPEKTVSLAISRWQNLGLSSPRIISLKEYDRIGLPVYTCSLTRRASSQIEIDSVFGKGITQEQAKASALMELVERVSCLSFLRELENFLISPYTTVKRNSIPLDYLLYPFAPVYREAELLFSLEKVPLIWKEVFDLTKGRSIFIPLHWFYYIYGTTGWAAGNTREEAILQALCEVIERHCISRVIEEKLIVPSIDPKSIKDKLIQELLERFTKAGVELIIKDFSLNLGIPTIAVIAHDPTPIIPKLRFYAAAGTHLNPHFAIIRALTELAQHRAQLVYNEVVLKRPGGPTFCFPQFKSRDEVDFLCQGETITFDMLSSFSSPDFKIEIGYLISILEKQRFQVYMVETTHKDLGIPAIIITIPGARLNRPSTKIHPYLLVARQLMNIAQYQTATEFLEKAFDKQPSLKNSPQVLCQAAACYKKAKNYERAAKYFYLAKERAPYLLQSRKFIAEFDEVLNKLEKRKR